MRRVGRETDQPRHASESHPHHRHRRRRSGAVLRRRPDAVAASPLRGLRRQRCSHRLRGRRCALMRLPLERLSPHCALRRILRRTLSHDDVQIRKKCRQNAGTGLGMNMGSRESLSELKFSETE